MAVEAFQQGRYAEAETRLVSALKKAEQFAVGDSRLATNLDSLAFFYSTQLKHAEAEPLYRRLLTIKEKALGPIHPDVATTLNNLAKQYQAQGKYAEAERLYQRALTIDEKVLGPNHPNVAVILGSYVALLRETNRTEDAARLLAAHTKGDGSRGTLPICPD